MDFFYGERILLKLLEMTSVMDVFFFFTKTLGKWIWFLKGLIVFQKWNMLDVHPSMS